jgi:16S rRNA (guanine527-N7)-methyltransferase
MSQGIEAQRSWTQRLEQGCRELGLKPSGEQIRCFQIYMRQLRIWNPSAGLISSGDEPRTLSRHFLDSLGLFRILDLLAGARVLDVGSGGGFPGLPLKMMRPEILLTILEPREKRFYFLKDLVRTIGLQGVCLRRQRAETASRNVDMRGAFDLVLARALASMDRLVSMCFPFVRRGGLFVAYKGQRIGREMVAAGGPIERAGGELVGMIGVTIPGSSTARNLVIVQRP